MKKTCYMCFRILPIEEMRKTKVLGKIKYFCIDWQLCYNIYNELRKKKLKDEPL